MDVAFISRIGDGKRVFTHVDAAPGVQLIKAGAADPLEDGYCQRVLDGRLPQLIHDARLLPEACKVQATFDLPVGAHVSVPIQLRDGSIYGTFCCFSTRAKPSLTEVHTRLMHVLAEVAGKYVEEELMRQRADGERRQRIVAALGQDAMSSVYQPIREIASGRIVGFESLTRFRIEPQRPPDVWFNEASAVGMSDALQLTAIERALHALTGLPDEIYLSCNISAETALKASFAELLGCFNLERIVLEITEHASVGNYDDLLLALAPLRERGLRLAIDDAGAGYASFRHILSLQPDLIKLDISLTRDIDTHPGRRALAAAFVGFARETGCKLVAEGVEREAELATLRALGVHFVQGYLVGRPALFDEALRSLAARPDFCQGSPDR